MFLLGEEFSFQSKKYLIQEIQEKSNALAVNYCPGVEWELQILDTGL